MSREQLTRLIRHLLARGLTHTVIDHAILDFEDSRRGKPRATSHSQAAAVKVVERLLGVPS